MLQQEKIITNFTYLTTLPATIARQTYWYSRGTNVMKVISNFLIRFKVKSMRWNLYLTLLMKPVVLGENLIKLLCKMNTAIKWFLMIYCLIPESWREKFLIINTETWNCTMCRQCETLNHSPASGLSVSHHSLRDKRIHQKARRKITRVSDSCGIQRNSIFQTQEGWGTYALRENMTAHAKPTLIQARQHPNMNKKKLAQRSTYNQEDVCNW